MRVPPLPPRLTGVCHTVVGYARVMTQQWFASRPVWRLSMLGGTLALTDDEVTFTPLLHLGATQRIALTAIERVEAHGDRPARLRITATGRRPLILMVLPDLTTTVWSRDNSARDAAITAITARLNTRWPAG